jgi:hypothetical protein
VSLAETLVTLFLLGLVIWVTGDLMRRGRNISSFYQQKSDLQRGAWALQRLCLQVQSASQILAPLLNSSADRLEWVRVRPDGTGRLPTTLGAAPGPVPPPNPIWDPNAAAWNETISVYRLDVGDLVWFGTSSEVLLGSQLSNFQSRSQGHMLELSAEVPVRGQVRRVLVKQLIAPGVSW